MLGSQITGQPAKRVQRANLSLKYSMFGPLSEGSTKPEPLGSDPLPYPDLQDMYTILINLVSVNPFSGLVFFQLG